MTEQQRVQKLQRRLGLDEGIDGGCMIERDREPRWSDLRFGLSGVSLALTAVLAAGEAMFALVRWRRERQGGSPSRLPDGPLALAVVGDQVLIGRRGQVLRTFPASEVLPTIARPHMSGEITLDGERFDAQGVAGDHLLRLRHLSP